MDPEIKRSLRQMALVTVVLMIVIVALGVSLAEPLTQFSHTVVDALGYVGIGLGIFLSDAFTLPIPPDVYLGVAVAAGLDPFWVILVGSVGSICGGIVAFGLGRWFSRLSFAIRVMEPFQERGTRFIRRMGVTAVIVAALTPIPFSIICMLAGMLKMGWKPFLPATLFRIPRIALYFLLIDLGWSAATSL